MQQAMGFLRDKRPGARRFSRLPGSGGHGSAKWIAGGFSGWLLNLLISRLPLFLRLFGQLSAFFTSCLFVQGPRYILSILFQIYALVQRAPEPYLFPRNNPISGMRIYLLVNCDCSIVVDRAS